MHREMFSSLLPMVHLTVNGTGLMIAGQLAFVETTGRDSWAYVDFNGVRLTATMSGSIPVGTRVQLSIQPEQVHLFDKITGASLRSQPAPDR